MGGAYNAKEAGTMYDRLAWISIARDFDCILKKEVSVLSASLMLKKQGARMKTNGKHRKIWTGPSTGLWTGLVTIITTDQ